MNPEGHKSHFLKKVLSDKKLADIPVVYIHNA